MCVFRATLFCVIGRNSGGKPAFLSRVLVLRLSQAGAHVQVGRSVEERSGRCAAAIPFRLFFFLNFCFFLRARLLYAGELTSTPTDECLCFFVFLFKRKTLEKKM